MNERYLNQDEALNYRNSIEDPVIRISVCSIRQFSIFNFNCDGQFDVLFYMKLVYELFKNKELVIKQLSGQDTNNVFQD